MSPAVILYLAGMALIWVGERLLGGDETWRITLGLTGMVVIGLSFALRARALRETRNDGVRLAHRRAFVMQAIGAASLLVYLMSSDLFIDMAGFEGEFEERWAGVFGALWPVIWLAGTLPYLVLDHAIQSSPVLMPARRVKQALNQGLAAALGIALVFPVNFIASRHDTHWSFSYFKTARPGSATIALVESLEEPVDVRVFQPAASDVTAEIMSYFDAIDRPNLRVEVIDQAADPSLARALRITDNGYIAVTRGEVDPANKNPEERPMTERVRIGSELRQARPRLKRLDEEFGKALIGIARGELIGYVTQGHGEASWGDGARSDRSLEGFKQVTGFTGMKLKKLGLTEGLAEEIPEDAEVVFILGPTEDFLEAEVEALMRYLDRGGAIMLALEPSRPGGEALGADRKNLGRLLDKLGVEYGQGVLASTKEVVAMANNRADRMNVTTQSFSTHPSTVVLAESSARMFVSIAGHLKKAERGETDLTLTVRSPAHSWADLDANLEHDTPNETRKARGIAAAVTGGSGDEWRGIVTSDATMFTDLAIIVKGNQQFVADGVNWLTRSESFSGTVESEEDVEIQHTREGQAGWFYATVVGFPLLILIVGGVRTRRRKGGDQ